MARWPRSRPAIVEPSATRAEVLHLKESPLPTQERTSVGLHPHNIKSSKRGHRPVGRRSRSIAAPKSASVFKYACPCFTVFHQCPTRSASCCRDECTARHKHRPCAGDLCEV